MRRLFISFSGGETSGYMAYLLTNTAWRSWWDEIVTALANTAEENEQTLIFADRCDKAFGLDLVWLEADVQHGKRESTGHRIVSFETASRHGEPFEEVIKKYGIPNPDWPHCTRELKQNPMYSYLESIGWEYGTYDIAIGIRADERERAKQKPPVFYPLADPRWRPTTKPQVNEFWTHQPFRLELTGYQGNCKTCWKKSLPKLMTIMDESPEKFDFFERMEAQYGAVGAEFGKPETKYERRVFFRGNRSTKDLRTLHESNKDNLEAVVDDSKALPQPSLFDSCMESCEVEFSR